MKDWNEYFNIKDSENWDDYKREQHEAWCASTGEYDGGTIPVLCEEEELGILEF